MDPEKILEPEIMSKKMSWTRGTTNSNEEMNVYVIDDNSEMSKSELDDESSIRFHNSQQDEISSIISIQPTIFELEPFAGLYLDPHQSLAVASLALAGVTLLIAGTIFQDWRTDRRDEAVNVNWWIMTSIIAIVATFIQILGYIYALFTKWEEWIYIHIAAIVVCMVSLVLSFSSELYSINLENSLSFQIRGIIFILCLIIDIIFMIISTWFVYYWTLFYKCL